jgi:outer membrane protein assembly factor BamB
VNHIRPIALLAAGALAALAAEPAAKPGAAAQLLRTDPDVEALFAQARQLTEARQYRPAVELYQGIIEKAADRVLPATNTTTGHSIFLPATMAAREALLTGPAALRAEYDALHGPRARQLIEEALSRRDTVALRRAATQFAPASVTQRARWWLASLLADEGDLPAAAAAWDEFLTLQPLLGNGDADLAATLAQQAVVLARSGDRAAACAVLARLEREFPNQKRRVGGREQAVVEFVRQTLDQPSPASRPPAPLEPLAPTPRWTFSRAATMSSRVASDGERLFVRTASDVIGLELASGKRIWQAVAPMLSSASMPRHDSRSSPPDDRAILDLPRFAVETDGGTVYLVENYPLFHRVPDAGGFPAVQGRGRRPPHEKYAGSSQLTARDAVTGRLVWRAGYGEGSDEFAQAARWISAPTVRRGRIFVIALRVQSYYLCCLDAADGRLLWKTFLSQRPEVFPGWPAQADLDRPAAPCVTAGRVLCLTNAGVLVCLDQHTGEPFWFCQYQARLTPGRSAVSRPSLPAVSDPARSVCAAGRVVLMTPADAENVSAVDLLTGTLLWARPHENLQLLAALTADAAGGGDALALLTGPSARALRLSDGEPVWSRPLHGPSGRAVLRGNTALWLQRGNGILQLDARTGTCARSAPLPTDAFNHLSLAGDTLVASGDRSLGVLWPLREAIEAATARVAAQPDDARPLVQRARLSLQSGQPRQALDDLLRARQIAPASELDTLLFRCHLEIAASDPKETLRWLERAGDHATTAAARSERRQRIAEFHAAKKAWSKSCESLQAILENEPETLVELPESDGPDDTRLVAGRVSNRSLAIQRIEQLVAAHGIASYGRAETTARQRLAAARKRDDNHALLDLIERHPVGESQELARLALAERCFAAGDMDRAVEILDRFAHAPVPPMRAADAALGLTLAGLRSERPAVARLGLERLAAAPPKVTVRFAGTSGAAGQLGRALQRQLPAPRPLPATAQAQSAARIEIATALSAELNLAGDQLFIEGQSVLRTRNRGADVVWVSAPVLSRDRNAVALHDAAQFLDVILLRVTSQLVALDADTGRLLWQWRGLIGPRLSSDDADRARVRALRFAGGPFFPPQERAPSINSSTFVVGGNQLLSLQHGGLLEALSPRRGQPIWSVRLPGPASAWNNAQPRVASRFAAIPGTAQGDSTTQPVAVVDLWRGRLLAVWNLPEGCADFVLREDGRVAISR